MCTNFVIVPCRKVCVKVVAKFGAKIIKGLFIYKFGLDHAHFGVCPKTFLRDVKGKVFSEFGESRFKMLCTDAGVCQQ